MLQTLSGPFYSREMSFESKRALEVAPKLFRAGAADFADGLHVALAAQVGEMSPRKLDPAAPRVSGARLLAGL